MKLVLLLLSLMMSIYSTVYGNGYYDHTTFPATGSAATSAGMRAELDLIEQGFNKLPELTGNANKVVVVNAGGTGLTTVTLTNASALDGTRGLRIVPSNVRQGSYAAAGTTWTEITGTAFVNLFTPTNGDGYIVSHPVAFTALNIVVAANPGTPTTIVVETCQSGVWTAVTPTGLPNYALIGYTQMRGIPTTGWTTGACGTTNAISANFNLRIRATTSGLASTMTGRVSLATAHDITADEIIASDASGNKVRGTSVKTTVNVTVSGANGFDSSGSVLASTYYYLWAISNGSTWAGLLSGSATAPLLPTGYTYKVLLGGYSTDVNSLFMPWWQVKDRVSYTQGFLDLNAGTATTPTRVTVTTPPIAIAWIGNARATSASAGAQVALSPEPAVSDLFASSLFWLGYGESTTGATAQNKPFGPLEIPMKLAQTLFYAVRSTDTSPTASIATMGYRMPGSLQ